MKRTALTLLVSVATIPALANSRVVVTPDHPILGTWVFALPGQNCSETYRFFPNGTSRVTSGEEEAESEYEISAQPGVNGFYRLVDTVTKDNGKKDCMGQVTPAGDKATNYIRFHPSGNAFVMCQAESLDTCFGPLNRVKD